MVGMRSRSLALLAVAAAIPVAAALAQDRREKKQEPAKETTKEISLAEQGLRFSIPDGYSMRTKGLRPTWPGLRCEIESDDGQVSGVLCLYVGAEAPATNADAREADWKGRRGVADVTRVRDEKLEREGAWLARETALSWGNEKRHYRSVFTVRGSRCVELAIWTKAELWDAKEKAIRALADALEWKRVWLCASCGKDTGRDAQKCPGCGADLVAPDADLEAWARKYGIRIVTDVKKVYPFTTAGERVVAKQAPPEDVRDYCALLAKEVRRYPDELWRKLAIERVVLGKTLFGGSTRRGALVDNETDSIHCDVSEGKHQEGFQVTAFHHELFHVMDRRDDGETHKDPVWEALNAPGFKYGPRNAKAAFDGFASIYAMTNIAEDKAEIFGNFMCRPSWVLERARTDQVFGKKLAQLEAQLKAWCPAIDEKFWRAG